MVNAFILEHADDDVNLLALKRSLYPELSIEDMNDALQQIEGRQKARTKLPAFYANEDILYPKRLNMEQCSSEPTARYKQSLITAPCTTLTDLTGGFGIDTYWLSQLFEHTDYVERDADLCRISQHNFRTLNAAITVHHADAVTYLHDMPFADCIYIDPARRDKYGKKVFRLADCQPDITQLWDLICSKSRCRIVKLSPLIDIRDLQDCCLAPQQIHIVAVDGECKEVLAVSDERLTGCLVAVNIHGEDIERFSFTYQDEADAQVVIADKIKTYLYEPNAAIMKAGAYKLVGARWELEKLAPNSHLYTSDTLHTDFQGRVFRVTGVNTSEPIRKANVIVRNYPLTAESLRKKLHVSDGGDDYIIGTTIGKKPILIHATKGERKIER